MNTHSCQRDNNSLLDYDMDSAPHSVVRQIAYHMSVSTQLLNCKEVVRTQT